MLGKKTNNRKYSGGSRRPDKTKFRREEAKERQEAWNALSPAQKIARLDAKLGAGVGAEDQRARLQEQLEAK